MNILIASVGNARTNEIKVLAAALNKKHNVTIACMAKDSGYRGQAFSFNDEPVRVSPLLYKEIVKNANWISDNPAKAYSASLSTSGKKSKTDAFDSIAAFEFFSNPADAVSIMLGEIMLHNPPDVVICGINNGVHMGQDIYTSSNIGMAMEATFFGIPAIAVGMEWKVGGHSEPELEHAVKFIEKNIEKLADLKLAPQTFLSVSIPKVENYKEFKGVKITKMSNFPIARTYVEKTDARGQKYYWVNRFDIQDDEYKDKFICITPLSFDSTDYKTIHAWQTGAIAQMKEGGL